MYWIIFEYQECGGKLANERTYISNENNIYFFINE